MLRRRPSRGLLAGLYEFPSEEGWLTAEEAVGKARSYGCQPVRISPLQDSRHIFSHREWLMHGYEIWTGSFPEDKQSEKNMEAGSFPEEKISEKDRGSEQALSQGKAGVPFFVSVSELQDRYAVPGAYAAYLSILTGEHLRSNA